MPKVKAGTLKPVIDQLKSEMEQKGDSLSLLERRSLNHRLKRLQRKAKRIRTEEERRAAVVAKAASAAAKAEEPEVEEAKAEKPAAEEAKIAEPAAEEPAAEPTES